MRSHARVAVIGGGIAGASVLYHLARLGWTDTILLEQGDLADGTTWHSAGHCIIPYVSRQMTRFTRESIAVFQGLEAESGRSAGFHEIGSLTLAPTYVRADELKRLHGAARVEGVPFELIGPGEVPVIWPQATLDGVIVAGHSPTAGRVDPASATAGLTAAAKRSGAEVQRRTRVLSTQRTSAREWSISTTAGAVRAEYLVNATGQWARETARSAGVQVPIVPLEHQYVLTGAIAELEGAPAQPILRDPDNGFYLRQEGEGLLVGIYEDDVRAWGADGIPPDFLRRLLPGDIHRIAPWLKNAGRRVPILAEAGIRQVVNGPDAYTPDDRFLMGPAPGLPTYFVFAGFNSAGVQTSPGAARYLAEWIVGGEPTADLDEFDLRRFGPHAMASAYVLAGAMETYHNHYPVRHPIEERRSARPLRMSPIHELLAARGAVFGERYGWERPVWFARQGERAEDRQSFRRPAWFDAVKRECLAIRDAVGVVDQTSFSKHLVEGPGAAPFLDRMIATRLPEVGSLGYALMLNAGGGIEIDLTISRLAPDTFYLVGAAAGEVRDAERIREHLPVDGSVSIRTISTEIGVLTVSGPRSRALLERASGVSMPASEFPFMSWRELPIGLTVARALRVSYAGELGWELHVPIETLRTAYLALVAAGEDLGLVDVGYRALDSLGLEKGYGLLGADLTREYTPLRAGLGRLIRFDKGSFIGRDALLRERAAGPTTRLAWLLFEEGSPALPSGMEPVCRDGGLVGFTVRGAYGHRIDRPLAVAYLAPEVLADPRHLTVEILGEEHGVVVSPRPPYDPENTRREPDATATVG
jgi:dimethylglycine dehydrogenase